MSNKICVVGSINMDVTLSVTNLPKTGETIFGWDKMLCPGGKGFNQALTAAKTGAEVSFVGGLGNDAYAKLIIDIMKVEGIDTKWIKMFDTADTGEAFIVAQHDGKNFIIVSKGANALLDIDQIQSALTETANSDIFLSQFEVPAEAIQQFFSRAKELGKLTMLNPAPAQEISDKLLLRTDIIIPNETELEYITGCSAESLEGLREGARYFLDRGVKLVIVTLGKRGAAIITRGECAIVPADRSVTAVDSTGAGDSFIGAFASAVDVSDFMNMEKLTRWVEFAQSIAQKVIMKKGAYEAIKTL